MTRRMFFTTAVAWAGAATGSQVQITINTRRKRGVIPRNFLGLGYEISSVSIPGLLSEKNTPYVDLVRKLGHGVVRVGGITADYASFAPQGQAVSTPKSSIVNLANLRELSSFLRATGWQLIWALNLGTRGVAEAVVEAEAVTANIGDKLLAFEIGNEPDLFNRGSSSHRPSTYEYGDWLKEYRHYKKAIREKLPNAVFAGPDAASATDWVTRLAADEGSDLKLLTHHYYRECAGPNSTLDKLLRPDPKLAPLLNQLAAATAQSGVPYRICETNSFCGGGKQGVSDTFGSALWVLDFLWRLADAGCAGVNVETGLNQLDFVSWYSPIAENAAKPEYFGMLAFAQSVGGERVEVTTQAGDVNVSAYAVVHGQITSLTIVNKDVDRPVDVTVTMDRKFSQGKVMRLVAPSIESKQGVTLGDADERLAMKGNTARVHLEQGSAVVIT